MKKNFVGNIKPHVELDGMSLRIHFGEHFSLEEWQTGHPEFQMALKSGWVLSSDRAGLVLNTIEKPVVRAPYKTAKEAVTTTAPVAATKAVETGIDPALLSGIAENQSLLMRNLMALQNRPEPAPLAPVQHQDNELLKELINQQKTLIGIMSQQRSESTSPDVVNLLKEIKESLAKPQTVTVYNQSGSGGPVHNDGFKVVEVEAEKFVPKVEDLNVKSAKIVTEQHSTGSVDDTLAALKKLKGK